MSMMLVKSNPDETISRERESIAKSRKHVKDWDSRRNVTFSLDNLANLLPRKGEEAEAESLYLATLPMWRERFYNDHSTVANTLDHLAAVVTKRGRVAEAEDYRRECFEIRRRKGTDGEPD